MYVPHMLHVVYIYLHLVYFYGKWQMEVDIPYMEHLGT